MRIKKLKWNNHPILGNLEIDFTNVVTGLPFDSIIFAGENGSGKTTILESISSFLNIGSCEYFDYIEYTVGGANYSLTPVVQPNGIKDFFNIFSNGNLVKEVRSNKNNNREDIEATNYDPRNQGCVFSKARADYKTSEIRHTTTKQLDIDKYDVDNEDDFTSLKQLLIDVQNQDDSQYSELNRNNPLAPLPWNDFYPNSKIFRFKNSFDSFFSDIKYSKVADENNEKKIYFTKNGRNISIDLLSTGEKQIVFRGAYLLKNSGRLSGASIMIDEPELSMHPKWQKAVLGYYKKLFTENNQQSAQLFFATHSQYVLEDALSQRDRNLVIVLQNENHLITAKRIDAPIALPSITSAETNYLAFDVVSNDYHIQLYGWLQEKSGLSTIKLCDDYIKDHVRYNEALHQKPSSFGNTRYETLCTYIRNAISHPNQANTFTEAQLRESIKLLIILCQ